MITRKVIKAIATATLALIAVASARPLLVWALASSASTGNTRLLTLILSVGIRPDESDSREATITPLMCAGQNGQVETARILIDHGADVNKVGFLGMTPLIAAGQGGNPEVISLLLEKGANINAKTADRNETALTEAVENGHTEAVRVLIEKGADRQVRSAGCGTALDCASHAQRPDIVAILKEPETR